MASSPDKNNRVSRRKVLPLLGGSLLFSFFGYGRQAEPKFEDGDDTYETLLKPDGTTVQVKKSNMKSARVIKKNISNNSLLNWLGKNK